MGWFDEQIRERITLDDKNMQSSYQQLAGVVDVTASKLKDALHLHSALEELCHYYKITYKKIPSRMTSISDQIDYLFKNTGLMYRRVTLSGNWWKDLSGPVLAQTHEGQAVVLIPNRFGTYFYTTYDPLRKVRLDKQSANNIAPDAIVFYEPLPARPLSVKDLFRFMNRAFLKADAGAITVLGILVALLGLVTPYLTQMLFDAVLPTGRSALLWSFAIMLVAASLATYLITTLKQTYMQRISQTISRKLKSAIFARILSLPVDFFKKYRSGDLASRVLVIDQLSTIYVDTVFGIGLTLLLSLIYIFQIFTIAPSLTFWALVALILQLLCGAISIYADTEMMTRSLEATAKLEGLVYSIFSGIQKIKLAGAEKRAFKRWAQAYTKKAEASYNPTLLRKIALALSASISILGLFLIYAGAAGTVDLGQFVAFNTAYAMVNASFTTLIATGSSLSQVKPILDLAKPVLEAAPELEPGKEEVKSLSGNIELNNVSFRYRQDGPDILDNLSLKIKRGQYVAIVGKTGSGKSTLLRLLLGFEAPDKGAVYYDGKDLKKLDKQSLRKKIGIVMQDGSVFADSIFENIAISSPELTMKEAWEAAEIAGLKQDIEDFPMGMGTLLSEGGGGISGGQKQRLLIARAVAPKPKILMLDEATSALDNLTQKQVSDALAKMKSTRLVIAHRLSTIKECDRIVVLDQGKIVEDGTYEELVEKNGFFADLVKRQMIEEPA